MSDVSNAQVEVAFRTFRFHDGGGREAMRAALEAALPASQDEPDEPDECDYCDARNAQDKRCSGCPRPSPVQQDEPEDADLRAVVEDALNDRLLGTVPAIARQVAGDTWTASDPGWREDKPIQVVYRCLAAAWAVAARQDEPEAQEPCACCDGLGWETVVCLECGAVPVQQDEPEGVCAFPNCSCTENRCPAKGERGPFCDHGFHPRLCGRCAPVPEAVTDEDEVQCQMCKTVQPRPDKECGHCGAGPKYLCPIHTRPAAVPVQQEPSVRAPKTDDPHSLPRVDDLLDDIPVQQEPGRYSDRERVADYLASAQGVEFHDLNDDAQREWLMRASDALRAVWSIGRLVDADDGYEVMCEPVAAMVEEVRAALVPVQQDEPEGGNYDERFRDFESGWEAGAASVRDDSTLGCADCTLEVNPMDDQTYWQWCKRCRARANELLADDDKAAFVVWHREKGRRYPPPVPVQQDEPEGVCAFPNCSCTENRCPGVGGEPCRGCGVPTGVGAYHHIGCRTPEPNPVPVQQDEPECDHVWRSSFGDTFCEKCNQDAPVEIASERCRTCKGSGTWSDESWVKPPQPCKACSGSGRVPAKRKAAPSVPEAAPLPRSRPPRSHRDTESLRRWEARHPSVRFPPAVPVQQDELQMTPNDSKDLESGPVQQDEPGVAGYEAAYKAVREAPKPVPVQQDEPAKGDGHQSITSERGDGTMSENLRNDGVCAAPNCDCISPCPGVPDDRALVAERDYLRAVVNGVHSALSRTPYPAGGPTAMTDAPLRKAVADDRARLLASLRLQLAATAPWRVCKRKQLEFAIREMGR